jgi:TRAP-type C4-dicarboxylate transport system permease small subunit
MRTGSKNYRPAAGRTKSARHLSPDLLLEFLSQKMRSMINYYADLLTSSC